MLVDESGPAISRHLNKVHRYTSYKKISKLVFKLNLIKIRIVIMKKILLKVKSNNTIALTRSPEMLLDVHENKQIVHKSISLRNHFGVRSESSKCIVNVTTYRAEKEKRQRLSTTATN